MLATTTLALSPIPARPGRQCPGPFRAPRNEGVRLPEPLAEQAEAILQSRGNREACWRLFVHVCIALYGSWRRRALPFTIVTEYLADGPLGLTLAQLDRALKALVEAGLIERVGEGGWQKSKPKPRRLPTKYRLAAWVQQALQDADADLRNCRRRQLAAADRLPLPLPGANAEKGREDNKTNLSKASPHLPAASPVRRQRRPLGPLCPPDPRRQQALVDLAALAADPRPVQPLSAGALARVAAKLAPYMPPGARWASRVSDAPRRIEKGRKASGEAGFPLT